MRRETDTALRNRLEAAERELAELRAPGGGGGGSDVRIAELVILVDVTRSLLIGRASLRERLKQRGTAPSWRRILMGISIVLATLALALLLWRPW